MNDLTPSELFLSSSKTLQRKINENRRFHKYEKMLFKIRSKIFDYEDQGKLEKAHRIINKIKIICEPWWRRRQSVIADRKLNPQIYK